MRTRSVFLCLLPGVLVAQDLPYSSGSTGADGPFAPVQRSGPNFRVGAACAYDEARGRIVVFGGYNYLSGNQTQMVTETHTYASGAWSLQSPATVPPARHGHAMAWDATRQEVVTYGGQNLSGYGNPPAGQTLTWNGSNWTVKSPSATPGSLAHHAMAWDGVRQEVILHGGYTGSAASAATWGWNGVTWANKAPAATPGTIYHHAMAWDPVRQEIVLFGGYRPAPTGPINETWVWNGTTWIQRTPPVSPSPRYSHSMAWDAVRQEMVLHGGYSGSVYLDETWVWNGTTWTQKSPVHTPGARTETVMCWHPGEQKVMLTAGYDRDFMAREDTWMWNGMDWEFGAGSELIVDMRDKPNGVWNHTSINVPQGLTVRFRRNAANTPVTWLATEDVVISGTVNLDGRPGYGLPNLPGNQPSGGPGGYDGGLGGNRVELYNTYAGTPGGGPGGGAPGIANRSGGGGGTHQGIYGNAYLIPLTGGSGGGGSAAYDTSTGVNGGGGGGAILIASSRDITVNGTIRANGGDRFLTPGSTYSGFGAGGGIKLVCDRLHGTGSIQARRYDGTILTNVGGYVRLESYLRPFDIGGTVSAGNRSNAAPVMGINYNAVPSLVISQVKGTNVVQPPSGSFVTPDVVFSEAGPVSIVVTAANIPDGTPVTMRINTASGTISLPAGADPPVTLAGGTATFSATVPAGHGTIQAFASFNVNPVSSP